MYFVILIRLCLIRVGGGLRSSAKKSQILVTLRPIIVGGGKLRFLEDFPRISNYSGLPMIFMAKIQRLLKEFKD